jgi:hypothetical protein
MIFYDFILLDATHLRRNIFSFVQLSALVALWLNSYCTKKTQFHKGFPLNKTCIFEGLINAPPIFRLETRIIQMTRFDFVEYAGFLMLRIFEVSPFPSCILVTWCLVANKNSSHYE